MLQGNGLDERPGPELLNAAEALCRDAETQGALEDENIAPSRRQALLREHATSLYAPICARLAATVRKATPSKALHYLTDTDFSEYATGVCAVIGDYIHQDASFDERLFSDHPELLKSFCAATFGVTFADHPELGVPRSRAKACGRKLCTRLVRARLLVGKGAVAFGMRPGSERVLKETAEEFAEH